MTSNRPHPTLAGSRIARAMQCGGLGAGLYSDRSGAWPAAKLSELPGRASAASRLLVSLVVVALFGIDSLRPILGLSQPAQAASQDRQDADEPDRSQGQEEAARVVLLSSRQDAGPRPCSDLWPTVPVERVVPAAAMARWQPSEDPGGLPTLLMLPPSPVSGYVQACDSHTTLSVPAAAPACCLPFGQPICPIGPPLA